MQTPAYTRGYRSGYRQGFKQAMLHNPESDPPVPVAPAGVGDYPYGFSEGYDTGYHNGLARLACTEARGR